MANWFLEYQLIRPNSLLCNKKKNKHWFYDICSIQKENYHDNELTLSLWSSCMGTDASQVLVSDISFNRKNQGSLRDWNHREKYLNNEIYKSTAIELEHLVISNEIRFHFNDDSKIPVSGAVRGTGARWRPSWKTITLNYFSFNLIRKRNCTKSICRLSLKYASVLSCASR